MISMVLATTEVPSAPPNPNMDAICAVGRAALRDLPDINHNRRFDTYYAGPGAGHRDLIEACPTLIAKLPKGYPLANDDAHQRASAQLPVPGQPPVREAFLYWVGVPMLGVDAATATVRMGYSCTGLCGAAFEARYRRTGRGWQRVGAIRNLYVSQVVPDDRSG